MAMVVRDVKRGFAGVKRMAREVNAHSASLSHWGTTRKRHQCPENGIIYEDLVPLETYHEIKIRVATLPVL
jgi:hypothetical protein